MPPKPAPSFDGGGVNGTAVLVTSSGWSPVDKTNLPLLASLASFCGVAAIFILYAYGIISRINPNYPVLTLA
jgi:hypothetical protein